MKHSIKSLLLGSAATLVAVSSANAADAVVVEPEPVEYVRVCDAYGSGFFFIPGTETCIRLSGFIRSSYEVVDFDGVDAAGAAQDDSVTFWGQRARLNVDVRNETDWGTLRSVYRLEGGDSNTDADVDMDVALISLAGFRAGFAGGNFWSSNHGFSGNNFEGIGSNVGGGFLDEGWYGFNDATIFDYTWASDGFSVTVGVEDPRITRRETPNNTNNGGTESRANFYAGFKYSNDLGNVAFTAVRDSLAVGNVAGDQGGWAYKVSADLDLSSAVPGGYIHLMYAWDDEYRTDYVHNQQVLGDPESLFNVSVGADLSDEVEFIAQYSYAEGDDQASGDPVPEAAEGDAYLASVGLNWFPAAAPGFSLRTSYFFGEVDNANATADLGGGTYDFDGFAVTVRRNF